MFLADVIRVGSRSKSELLKKCNLNKHIKVRRGVNDNCHSDLGLRLVRSTKRNLKVSASFF